MKFNRFVMIVDCLLYFKEYELKNLFKTYWIITKKQFKIFMTRLEIIFYA